MRQTELAKRLKEQVANALANPNATYFIPMDSDLAIVIGWINGFDPNDDTVIHDKKDPQYCLSCKIGENIRDDYGWVYMPWNASTGDVYDTDTAFGTVIDYNQEAKYLLASYKEIRKGLDSGTLTFEVYE